MPLTNKAYLVLVNTSQFNEDGIFELTSIEVEEELNREMLLGNRGQAITGISNAVPILPQFGSEGSGINVDGGAGRDVITVTAEITQPEDGIGSGPQWGGETSSDLPADAQGRPPLTQAQILKNWARTTTTDSFKAGRLHWGEWTDGRFGELGAFDEPIPVVIQSVRLTHPRDDPSASTAAIELLRTSELPDTADIKDKIGGLFDDLK